MPARVTVPRPRTTPSRRLARAASAVAAGAVLALVAACGGDDPATTSAGASPYDLIRPGVLTAGTQTEQPPFAFVGDDGRPTGFAVDLTEEAAKRLGLRVEYKFTSLQGILSGLTAGAYDIGVAGVGATEERKKSVDFVKPYFWSYLAFLTPADSAVARVDDVAGKRVGVVSGSVQETYATKKLTGSEVIRFKDQPSAVGQLLTGGIDAFLVGGPDAEEYVEREAGRLRIAAEADSLQGTSLPIRKGDAALVAALDQAIDDMVADGTYERLYATYFTRPVSPLLVAERPSLKALAEKQAPAPTP